MLGSYLYHLADLLIEGAITVYTFIHVIMYKNPYATV